MNTFIEDRDPGDEDPVERALMDIQLTFTEYHEALVARSKKDYVSYLKNGGKPLKQIPVPGKPGVYRFE